MQGWWYVQDGQKLGPISTSEVENLSIRGEVGPQTLLWRPGQLGWQPLCELEPFRGGQAVDSTASGQAASAAAEPVATPTGSANADQALPSREHAASAESLPSWARTDPPICRDLLPPPGLEVAGPWRRFFAQVVDVWSLAAPSGYLIASIGGCLSPEFAIWVATPVSSSVFGLLALPVSLLLAAVIFGLFGTTLGKFILGIRVLTEQGARPTFQQYLRRTLGVYWYGYGLGIPFVTLVTMIVQYRKLRDDRRTSYDKGAFRVHATPFGPVRTAASVCATVLVTALVMYFNGKLGEEQRRYHAGFEWTNPVTGLPTDVPSGWALESGRNADGDEFYAFASGHDGVIAFFAKEATNLPLTEYQRLWVQAVRRDMTMREGVKPINANGRLGLEMRGVMANDNTRLVHATVVKNDRQVWRLVLVGTAGREPNTASAQKLREALLRTLKPGMEHEETRGSAV